MADNKTTYLINVKQQGAAKAEKGLKSLTKSVAKLTAAYLGTGALLSGVKSSIEAFTIQEQAEKKLEQALGRTSKALLDQASALQKVSNSGDEAIIAQQAFLASIGMTEKQIKEILPVALDLAAATGLTLESAVRNTAKTFSGLAGELGELVPQVRDLTPEAMKAGEAVKVMGQLFKGQAAAEVKTFAGELNQLRMAWGDAMEDIGRHLAESGTMSKMVQILKNASEAYKQMFPTKEKSPVKPFEEEIAALNKTLDEDVELLNKYGQALNNSNATWRMAGGTIEEHNKFLDEQAEKYGNLLFIIAETRGEILKYEELQKRIIDGTFVETKSVQSLSVRYNDVDTSLKTYLKTVDTSNTVEEDMVDTKKKVNAEMEKNIAVGFANASANKSMAASAIDASAAVVNAYLSEAVAAYLKDNVKFFKSVPPPFNAILLAGAGAAMSTGIQKIVQGAGNFTKDAIGAQYGFEGMVTEPTTFTVGEGGAAEYVSVQPMEGVNNAGGQGINIHISGNVMTQDFVENELSESIQEAVRKGVSFA